MRKFFCILFLLSLIYAQENLGGITTLPTKEKVVALTFDDGPKNGPTEKLLDLLRKENVKATFFINGRSVKNDPDLLLRIYKEGHVIGNHTYSHICLADCTPEQMQAELINNNTLIERITGQKTKYLRAPGGIYNDKVYTLAKKLNLIVVNWSINTADYLMDSPVFEKGDAIFVRSAEMIESKILRQIQPGAIILMHNGNEETIEALSLVIPKLKKEGYKFAPITVN